MRMRGRRDVRGGEERQRQQLARLQQEINEQRRKITELEYVRNTILRSGIGSIAYEGTCAECGVGVIVRENDSLRCTSCRFRCHL